MLLRQLLRTRVLVGLLCIGAAGAAHAGPVPIGSSTTTFSYTTANGLQTFVGSRDYTSSSPSDATPLATAPNVGTFNSVNTFGRRTFVAATGPQFDQVLTADESLITHAFFKFPGQFNADYFPGIVPGSNITVQVDGINFDAPVTVDHDTIMLHSLFADAQVQGLPSPYFNLHNHEITSLNFRNFDDFVSTGVFSTFPVPNYVLGSNDLSVVFSGEGTNQLSVALTFPYSLLEHTEEFGQTVPDGLPAPQGFLEPFHFHLEYVVTPEPASLALLLPAALMVCRRRRR
ncbi:MAG: hypothetical protein ACE5E5_12060 [Phycisphaerae bacterium]